MVLRACVRTTELELALTTFSSSDHDASASANCRLSSCSLILAATLLHCCSPFSSTRDTWYSNGPHDNCNIHATEQSSFITHHTAAGFCQKSGWHASALHDIHALTINSRDIKYRTPSQY